MTRILKQNGQRLMLVTLVLGVVLAATWRALAGVTSGSLAATLEHIGLDLVLFLVGLRLLVAMADLAFYAILLVRIRKGG